MLTKIANPPASTTKPQLFSEKKYHSERSSDYPSSPTSRVGREFSTAEAVRASEEAPPQEWVPLKNAQRPLAPVAVEEVLPTWRKGMGNQRCVAKGSSDIHCPAFSAPR